LTGPATITLTGNTSLATPSSGFGNLGFNTTSKTLQAKASDATASYTVRDITCSGGTPVIGSVTAGLPACVSAGGGTGAGHIDFSFSGAGNGSPNFIGSWYLQGGTGFSFGAAATAFGYLSFDNIVTATMSTSFFLPDDMSFSANPTIKLAISDPSFGGGANAKFNFALQCFANGAALAVPTTNLADTGSFVVTSGPSLTISPAATITVTGCSAGSFVSLQITRDNGVSVSGNDAHPLAVMNMSFNYTTSL